MENLDEEVFNSRAKKKYRYKFKTQKTIQTVMGDLTFQRRYYIDRHTREGICFLDNILDLDTIGRTSLNLVERIIDNAVDNSYRESARKIENTTVTKVSHQTIKNKVDFAGAAIEKLENVRVARYLNNELKGQKESKILFEEKDGVFLRIQGKKHKQELKLAKVYEGWRKYNESYHTVGTCYYAGYEGTEAFDSIINSGIAEVYNEDGIQYIILNGDGSSLISAETENNLKKIYQLDLFHIYQKANRKIKNKEDRKKIKKLLKKKKYAETIEKLKEFIDKETDEKAKEELKEVFNYYNNNFDALIRYQDKKDIFLPQSPDGIEFKGLGTMESSIRNVLVLRMKNNGTAWSIRGTNHMSKLLCLKHSGDLHEQLKEMLKKSKVVDFIDINKMIIDKLNESKKAINDEVKILLKQQKKATKYNENIQSSIIYGQGKVTRMQQILKGR